jgi:hypothetical protein
VLQIAGIVEAREKGVVEKTLYRKRTAADRYEDIFTRSWFVSEKRKELVYGWELSEGIGGICQTRVRGSVFTQ